MSYIVTVALGLMSIGAIGAIVVAIVQVRRGLRVTKGVRAEAAQYWRERRRADRDDLLDSARQMVRSGKYRAMRFGEDVWGYAAEYQEWLGRQFHALKFGPTWSPIKTFKPVVPPMKRPSTLFQIPGLGDILKSPASGRHISGHHEASMQLTVQLYWWSIEREGVVHRGGIIKHDDLESYVLLCDTANFIDQTHVEDHLEGEGPLVTCLMCFSLRRNT